MISAFTTYLNGISNKLINEATIIDSITSKSYDISQAQWDTGATNTCISKRVVQKLGLTPNGCQNIQTPAGAKIVNQYVVDIKLRNDVTVTGVIVLDSEIGNQGIDLLIGMDIISLGDFSVSNYDGKTQFTFRLPSVTHTDYVQCLKNSTPIVKEEKTYPNAPCPCGSGKRYKKCCGR